MIDDAGTVRLACEAISRADIETLRHRVFAAGLRWHEPGRNLIAGDYEGRDEVLSQLVTRLAELTGGTYRLEIHDIMTSGGTVVGLANSTAARHGQILTSQDVCVLRLRDERIEEGWAYHRDQYGWDRFWS